MVSPSATAPPHGETTSHAVAVVDPYRLQLERFAAAVQGAARPLPALADSVMGPFTLDALLTSAMERTAIPVDVPALRAPATA